MNVNTAWRQLLLPQGRAGQQEELKQDLVLDRAARLILHRAIALLRHENQPAHSHASPGPKRRPFGPREISNMLHALAKSGRPVCKLCKQLIVELESRSLALISAFNGQDIGNMLWAYATIARVPAPQLLDALQVQAAAVAQNFSAQQISNSLWAFATLHRHPTNQLLELLQSRAEDISDEFNAQNIANTLWAFATLDLVPREELLVCLARRAAIIVGEFRGQHVANFVWSFAHFRIAPDEQLMEALEEQAQGLMAALTPHNLSNLMLSFATLGWVPREPLLHAMLLRISVSAKMFNTQDLANTLWAMAVYIARGVPCHALQLALQPLAKRTQDFSRSEYLPQHMSALHQFALACEKKQVRAPAGGECGTGNTSHTSQTTQDVEGIIPQMLDPVAHREAADTPQTSRSHMHVAAVLRELGLSVHNEPHCSVSGLSLDMCATRAQVPSDTPGSQADTQQRVFTVEFDGPRHFVRRLGTEEARKPKAARITTGTTELKHYLLRKLGHFLIVVPYWEWDAVALHADARRDYLRRKLSLHLDEIAPELLQKAAARIGAFTREDYMEAERSGRLSESLESLQVEESAEGQVPWRCWSHDARPSSEARREECRQRRQQPGSELSSDTQVIQAHPNAETLNTSLSALTGADVTVSSWAATVGAVSRGMRASANGRRRAQTSEERSRSSEERSRSRGCPQARAGMNVFAALEQV